VARAWRRQGDAANYETNPISSNTLYQGYQTSTSPRFSQPEQGGFLIAHDDPGVGAADEGAAIPSNDCIGENSKQALKRKLPVSIKMFEQSPSDGLASRGNALNLIFCQMFGDG
jgi:hypothetical protein